MDDVKTPPAPTPEPPDPAKPPTPDPAAPANELIGAPAEYGDFTLPEGVELDTEVLGEAKTLFKDLNTSQQGAQKLVDFHTKAIQSTIDKMIEKSNAQREEWRNAVKSDPALGQNLTQIKESIGRMYGAWGDDALVTGFKDAMNLTGVGDNPHFIKALYKMSQLVAEGRPVAPGGPPAQQKKTGAQVMYPNNPSSAAG